MAPYRYTISHTSQTRAAEVSAISTSALMEGLSQDTSTSEPDLLRPPELFTSHDPDLLAKAPHWHSGSTTTYSSQDEPILSAVSPLGAADRQGVSVDSDLIALYANNTPKQESASDEIADLETESATVPETNDKDMAPPQIGGESAPPAYSFLELPAEVRIQIYCYLFAKHQKANFGSDAVGQFKFRCTKRSGIALCFTCRHIAEESRPILYFHMQWVLKKNAPFISLLSNPFHHTNLIRNIVILARGNGQVLNSLAQHRLQFTSLLAVTVHTAGRVLTRKAPNRQAWHQLSVSLRDKWTGLPSEVWTAASLLNRTACKVVAVVDCMHYPYMKGKRRYWHEKEGLWRSQVCSPFQL